MISFASPLISGTLLRRYKRFLADVILDSGEELTVHCPNSGSMKTCVGEGWPCLLSKSSNPKRKLAYTLELIHNGSSWICVNTQKANGLVAAAIESGEITELKGYSSVRREVRSSEGSRLDLLLTEPGRRECFIEVKTVTLLGEGGYYQFPDAVTSRGLKHLHELQRLVQEGSRAVLFFLVLREDGRCFCPARRIDPTYADELKRAAERGVEILVYQGKVAPERLGVGQRITEVEL